MLEDWWHVSLCFLSHCFLSARRGPRAPDFVFSFATFWFGCRPLLFLFSPFCCSRWAGPSFGIERRGGIACMKAEDGSCLFVCVISSLASSISVSTCMHFPCFPHLLCFNELYRIRKDRRDARMELMGCISPTVFICLCSACISPLALYIAALAFLSAGGCIKNICAR